MYVPAHVRPTRPALRVFLDDVRATPDDDGLRLILADWLEDQDTAEDAARAELIRLQCAHATAVRRIGRLHRREQELIARWTWEWLGPLAELARPWQIDRGTLGLTFDAAAFFSDGLNAVCRTEAYAWADAVTLTGLAPGAMAYLVTQPLLDAVRELSVQESRIGNAGLAALAASPHLTGLRVLRLAQAGIGGRSAGVLAWPHLPHLHTLDLSQNHLWDENLHALLAAGLPEVRHLHLGYNNLGDEGVAVLAGSPLADGLESLNVAGNRAVGDAGLTRLAALKVRRLDASQAIPTEAGLRALGAMETLEELGLDRCELGDARMKELAFAPGLPRLHTLRAGRALLGDESLIALVTGRPRPWRRLELANNHLGPRGLEALAESPDAAGLRELNLAGNRAGDAGAFALARSPHLKHLTWLDLSGNGLTPAGAAALVRRFGRWAVSA
ncbi:MAG: TIGR02996 domain-containing protein [Gemmataceae bacterium]